MWSVSSVAQSCPTLCDPMNRSTPGLPVHHQLPEVTQTHVHRVGDAIQPSHPLSSPSPPAPNPSQHQGLFQCGRKDLNIGCNLTRGILMVLSILSFCASLFFLIILFILGCIGPSLLHGLFSGCSDLGPLQLQCVLTAGGLCCHRAQALGRGLQ